VILAIDAGNSRTKWAAFDPAGELKAQGIYVNTELVAAEVPVVWHACSRAIVSNVAGSVVAEVLQAKLHTLAIPVRWAAASATACGVRNSYESPQQLGSDRWAALIAAWQHYRAPCIVANAGTALTVDALGCSNQNGHGVFLGGLILPGFNLMLNSLAAGTSGLAQLSGSLQDFPTNTGDALHSGAISAMTGAITSMMEKLHQRESRKPHCILSGGDAALPAEALQRQTSIANHVVIADNLVLQGLLLIEREYS
jgi:type III pantothenate kinase